MYEIKKNSIEQYLMEYGIYIKRSENEKIYINESYPPFLNNIYGMTLHLVNDLPAEEKSSWKMGLNYVIFVNGKKIKIYLSEFNYQFILYDLITTSDYQIMQCIDFSEYKDLVIYNLKKEIYLDLRINFGGEINQMLLFYEKMIDFINLDYKNKLTLLISNNTCSSSEIFVYKMFALNRPRQVQIVGKKMFGKKYIYRKYFSNDTTYIVPYQEIKRENYEININFDCNFYYEDDIQKKYVNPQIFNGYFASM